MLIINQKLHALKHTQCLSITKQTVETSFIPLKQQEQEAMNYEWTDL